jgi:hypothetical protein
MVNPTIKTWLASSAVRTARLYKRGAVAAAVTVNVAALLVADPTLLVTTTV